MARTVTGNTAVAQSDAGSHITNKSPSAITVAIPTGLTLPIHFQINAAKGDVVLLPLVTDLLVGQGPKIDAGTASIVTIVSSGGDGRTVTVIDILGYIDSNEGGGGGDLTLPTIAAAPLITLGSSSNANPAMLLDPHVQGFVITTDPLPTGLAGTDGVGLSGIGVGGSANEYSGSPGVFAGGAQLYGGNAISATGTAASGGVGLFSGAAWSSVQTQAQGITISAQPGTAAGIPVGFTIANGGSGYVDGTYTDLGQLYVFNIVNEDESIGGAVTKVVVSGGAVTAIEGLYDVYGDGSSQVGDVLTMSIYDPANAVYPAADSTNPATFTVNAISIANTGPTAQMLGSGNELQFDGTTGNITIVSSSGSQVIMSPDGEMLFICEGYNTQLHLRGNNGWDLAAPNNFLMTANSDGYLSVQRGDTVPIVIDMATRTGVNSGDSIAADAGSPLTIMSATATIAALTYTMPPGDVDSQKHALMCNKAVTSLTLLSNDGSTTFENAPTSMAAGVQVVFIFNLASDVWERLQ